MVSTDRNIFVRSSEVRRRMIDYGKLVQELHIVVFTQRITNHESRIMEDKISGNVWVYPTDSANRLFYILDAIRLGREIIRDSLFIIHNSTITCQDPFETGFVGWRLKKKFNIPLQLQIHTDLFSPYFKKESFINRTRVKIAKFLLPRADGIRVVSKRIRDSLPQTTNHKLPTNILPIFVDVQKIRAIPISTDLHKKYPGKKIILMASRPTPEKNIPLAERAIEEVAKKHPEVFLFRVTDASFKDLISYYKTADVFLLTSNFEGYGMVLVEAASVGLPIVSTDVGIASEIKGARVVPVGDSKAVASALIDQIKNPQKTEAPETFSYQEYLNRIKAGWEACV